MSPEEGPFAAEGPGAHGVETTWAAASPSPYPGIGKSAENSHSCVEVSALQAVGWVTLKALSVRSHAGWTHVCVTLSSIPTSRPRPLV